MPANKRPRRERTDDWQKIQQYTLWPEQKAYELLRPVVLFNESTTERAAETGTAERSMYRKVAQFEEQGMGSLFAKEESNREPDKSRSLPPDMRQLIVDAHALSTLAFVPMKLQQFVFSALAEDLRTTPSSESWQTVRAPQLTHADFLPMGRSLTPLSVAKQ